MGRRQIATKAKAVAELGRTKTNTAESCNSIAKGHRHMTSLSVAASACLVALIAWLSRSLFSNRENMWPDMPLELRKLLRCGEICDRGISDEDKEFAEGARKHSQGSLESEHTEDLVKICMWRCQEGDKTAKETHGVVPVTEYVVAPAMFSKFVASAKNCAAAGFRKFGELTAGLRQCGVVHVENAVSLALLQEIRSAFAKLREDVEIDSMRTDSANLRGGRQETWVPFQHPFNDTGLFHSSPLRSAIREYLGPAAVLDHVSVITASGVAAKQPQGLHADVGLVGQHLEVHIPLVDVSAAMGPTIFCPATHGIAQRGSAGMTSGVERALEWWYLTPGARCAEDKSLSYARPLKIGQATIYDANVFHGGTANHAGVDRPVLQLSYSMSAEAVAERDYLKGTFKKNVDARRLVMEDVRAFRTAFSASM